MNVVTNKISTVIVLCFLTSLVTACGDSQNQQLLENQPGSNGEITSEQAGSSGAIAAVYVKYVEQDWHSQKRKLNEQQHSYYKMIEEACKPATVSIEPLSSDYADKLGKTIIEEWHYGVELYRKKTHYAMQTGSGKNAVCHFSPKVTKILDTQRVMDDGRWHGCGIDYSSGERACGYTRAPPNNVFHAPLTGEAATLPKPGTLLNVPGMKMEYVGERTVAGQSCALYKIQAAIVPGKECYWSEGAEYGYTARITGEGHDILLKSLGAGDMTMEKIAVEFRIQERPPEGIFIPPDNRDVIGNKQIASQ